jgi:hypothetical protein
MRRLSYALVFSLFFMVFIIFKIILFYYSYAHNGCFLLLFHIFNFCLSLQLPSYLVLSCLELKSA